MSINFNPNGFIKGINSIVQEGTKYYSHLNEPIQDTFVRTSKELSPYEKALKKAFDFCIQTVSGENPKESYYAIDSVGNAIDSGIGEKFRCSMDFSKLKPDSTVVHSHPESCLFSVQDLITLAGVDEIKTIGSIDSKGRTCLATKMNDCSSIKENIRFYKKYANSIFQTEWLEKFGVKPSEKEWLEFHENKLMESLHLGSKDELYSLFYIDRSDDPKKCMEALRQYAFISNGIQEFNPTEVAYNKISSKIDVSSEEGMSVMKKINEKICELFGFAYKYND